METLFSAGIRLIGVLAIGATWGCSAYYSSYRYYPSQETHEVQVAGDSTATLRMDARLLGILRPADEAPRRVHARLVIHNDSAEALPFEPASARATPSGLLELEPAPSMTEVIVAAGQQRSIDLLFPLPPAADLPATVLGEIELSWQVAVAGDVHRIHATFRRQPRNYYAADYFWGGPYPYPYPYPYYYPYSFYSRRYRPYYYWCP